jgi:hypothetical protein
MRDVVAACTAGGTAGCKASESGRDPPAQPPMITVTQPGGMICPIGLGIGATHEECSVWSPTRAAGRLLISTVVEPIMIMPGPAGTQPGSRQGIVIEVTVAAGRLPISTVGAPGGMIASGNPGCGSGVGVGRRWVDRRVAMRDRLQHQIADARGRGTQRRPRIARTPRSRSRRDCGTCRALIRVI